MLTEWLEPEAAVGPEQMESWADNYEGIDDSLMYSVARLACQSILTGDWTGKRVYTLWHKER